MSICKKCNFATKNLIKLQQKYNEIIYTWKTCKPVHLCYSCKYSQKTEFVFFPCHIFGS